MGLRLSDIQQTLPAARKGSLCTVARVRAALDPVDLETFDAWLASDRASSWIAAAIRAHPVDIDLGSKTIDRHRRGDCKCR